jgi:hypothetical protein
MRELGFDVAGMKAAESDYVKLSSVAQGFLDRCVERNMNRLQVYHAVKQASALDPIIAQDLQPLIKDANSLWAKALGAGKNLLRTGVKKKAPSWANKSRMFPRPAGITPYGKQMPRPTVLPKNVTGTGAQVQGRFQQAWTPKVRENAGGSFADRWNRWNAGAKETYQAASNRMQQARQYAGQRVPKLIANKYRWLRDSDDMPAQLLKGGLIGAAAGTNLFPYLQSFMDLRLLREGLDSNYEYYHPLSPSTAAAPKNMARVGEETRQYAKQPGVLYAMNRVNRNMHRAWGPRSELLQQIKIDKKTSPVKSHLKKLMGLNQYADAGEILRKTQEKSYQGTPEAQALLLRRFPQGKVNPWMSPDRHGNAPAFSSPEGVFIAPTLGDVENVSARDFLARLGKPAIKNHEFEHQYNQFTPTREQANDFAARQSTLRGWDATKALQNHQLLMNRMDTAKYDAPYLKALIGGSVYNTEQHEAIRKQLEKMLAKDLQTKLNNKYEVELDDATKEIAPTVGDVIFKGEEQRQKGTPLNYTFTFPGGKQHEIRWMLDQAKKHGYWEGRPMQDLIFNTSAGQAWYRDMINRKIQELRELNK